MFGFNPPLLSPSGSAMLAVPVWQVGGVAAVIAILCAILLFRSRFGRLTIAVATAGFVVTAIGTTVLFLERASVNEKLAERQNLMTRVTNLAAQSLTPGSPLACLAGDIGETVETACERVVFARPEAVASAVAYTGARLSLIADGLEYAKHADPAFADALVGVRRAIELDRYGMAAQVLATRDGCTPEQCPFFALARNSSALKANLTAHAFDTYVARYAAGWNAEEKPPFAEKPVKPPVPPQASIPEPAPHVVDNKYKFPSAASIPPVSIMTAEPPLPPDAKADNKSDGKARAEPDDGDAEKAATRLPVPPKRPQNQAAAPPAR